MYSSTSRGSQGRRAGVRRREESGQARVRLLQLAICLALFAAVSLWRGVFPQKLAQTRDDLVALITTDLDFQGALAELGESLAEKNTVLSDLGEFCVEVFGAGAGDEPAEPAASLLPPPAADSPLDEELRFLRQGPDSAERTIHYANPARFGLTVPAQTPEQAPEPVTEPAAQPEPAEIPAAGTVVAYSDYSGDPPPDNYTMDRLSLGELETMTPVLGHLNSGYGYRDHPIKGKYLFHGGVDIGGEEGDPIAAFASGTVEYIGEDDTFGQYLQLDHGNGVKSFYAHCSKLEVSKGDQVAMGDTVARVGSTGLTTGPHLHLELKFNKTHLNPAYYVEFLE